MKRLAVAAGRLARLLILLGMLCLGCCGRGTEPARDPVFPAAPTGQLPPSLLAAPPLPTDEDVSGGVIAVGRSVAADVLALMGDEALQYSAGATPDEPSSTMRLDSAADSSAWALYRFGGGIVAGDNPYLLELEHTGIPLEYWVGTSDYGRDTWRWQLVRPSAGSISVWMAFDSLPVSPAGNVYCCVLSYGGRDLTLEQLTLVLLPPLPPTEVQASDGTPDSHITLTWTRGENATGYRIYRDGETEAALVATVGDVDTWDDYGVNELQVYTYRLRSVDGSRRSPLSEPDTGFRTWLDPIAELEASPLDGDFPLEVHFDAGDSHSPAVGPPVGAGIVRYEFDFGDGGGWQDCELIRTAVHTYASEATYVARVRVTDIAGLSAQAGVTIHDQQDPVAELSADPAWGDFPLEVAFDASLSYDPDNGSAPGSGIEAWEFDFGEGGGWEDNGDEPAAQHTYTTPGRYTARVRVTDDDGATATAERVIGGGTAWTKVWGGSGAEQANAVFGAADGSMYLTGYTTSFGADGRDVLLLEYGPTGSLLLQRTWGGAGEDRGEDIAVDSTGNVYIVGRTDSYGAGGEDLLLLKYNSGGTLVWQKTWGGSGDDGAQAVCLDASGDIYIGGDTEIDGAEVCILRLSSSGGIVWQRGVDYPVDASCAAMTIDSSGNAYLVGRIWKEYSEVYGHTYRMLALRMDSAGSLGWQQQRSWGEVFTYGTDICLDSAGNPLILASPFTAGATIYDYGLVALCCDPQGEALWGMRFGDGFHDYKGKAIVVDPFGAIYVAGDYSHEVSPENFSFVMRLSSEPHASFVARYADYRYIYGLATDQQGALCLGSTSTSVGEVHDAWTPSFQESTGLVGTPAGVEVELSQAFSDAAGIESTPDGAGGGDEYNVAARKLAAAQL